MYQVKKYVYSKLTNIQRFFCLIDIFQAVTSSKPCNFGGIYRLWNNQNLRESKDYRTYHIV
jgi:hypothetical protein